MYSYNFYFWELWRILHEFLTPSETSNCFVNVLKNIHDCMRNHDGLTSSALNPPSLVFTGFLKNTNLFALLKTNIILLLITFLKVLHVSFYIAYSMSAHSVYTIHICTKMCSNNYHVIRYMQCYIIFLLPYKRLANVCRQSLLSLRYATFLISQVS